MAVNLRNEQLPIYRTRAVRGLEVSARDPLWSHRDKPGQPRSQEALFKAEDQYCLVVPNNQNAMPVAYQLGGRIRR